MSPKDGPQAKYGLFPSRFRKWLIHVRVLVYVGLDKFLIA
jgi:hypothetical protein